MKKRIITAISFVMLIVLCFTYVSCANIPNNATTEVETFENASLEVVEVTEEFTEESVISSSK